MKYDNVHYTHLPDPEKPGQYDEILRLAIHGGDSSKAWIMVQLLADDPNPGSWGILLADVVHNVTNAMLEAGLEQDGKLLAREEILGQILSHLVEEVVAPTAAVDTYRVGADDDKDSLNS